MGQADHPYARDLTHVLDGKTPGELAEMLVEIQRAIWDREAVVEQLTASYDRIEQRLQPLRVSSQITHEELVLVESYYQPSECRRESRRPALVTLKSYGEALIAVVSNLTSSDDLEWPEQVEPTLAELARDFEPPPCPGSNPSSSPFLVTDTDPA